MGVSDGLLIYFPSNGHITSDDKVRLVIHIFLWKIVHDPAICIKGFIEFPIGLKTGGSAAEANKGRINSPLIKHPFISLE